MDTKHKHKIQQELSEKVLNQITSQLSEALECLTLLNQNFILEKNNISIENTTDLRIDCLEKSQPDNSLGTSNFLFQNEHKKMPVHKVPIDLPKYRLENGRTISLQEEAIANNPKLETDFFNHVEDENVQEQQHKILLKLA